MKPNYAVVNLRAMVAFLLLSGLVTGRAIAAEGLQGQVLGGGAPFANSTVTLWAATAGSPAQLGQVKTGADGHFSLSATSAPAKDASLYLVARGGRSAVNKSAADNPAIALITVLGNKPPAKATINEMTTVASVRFKSRYYSPSAEPTVSSVSI